MWRHGIFSQWSPTKTASSRSRTDQSIVAVPTNMGSPLEPCCAGTSPVPASLQRPCGAADEVPTTAIRYRTPLPRRQQGGAVVEQIYQSFGSAWCLGRFVYVTWTALFGIGPNCTAVFIFALHHNDFFPVEIDVFPSLCVWERERLREGFSSSKCVQGKCFLPRYCVSKELTRNP
jgi:hypothetical protein